MGQVKAGAIAERRADMIAGAAVALLLALGALALSWIMAERLLARAIGLALILIGFGVGFVVSSLRPARLTYDTTGLVVWAGERKAMTLGWERVERFIVINSRSEDGADQVGWVRRHETNDFILRLPDEDDDEEAAGRLESNFGLTAKKLARLLNARLAESRTP
ncbi:MAG: hypothetical protein JWP35_1068 [Caulobacter sp.]|nr:hypothetical protein [Caulobacter sp.]